MTYTQVNTCAWLYKQYTRVHNMHMSISKNLQREMDRVGVTQYSLEKLSKVPQPTIQRILKGSDPKASTVKKLAHALGVSSSMLLDGGFGAGTGATGKASEPPESYNSSAVHPSLELINKAIITGKLGVDELKLLDALSVVLSKSLN